MRVTTRSSSQRSWLTITTAPTYSSARNVLQPAAALDVEVVGGLVEEEKIGLFEQEFREAEPGLLPAGEGGDRCAELADRRSRGRGASRRSGGRRCSRRRG
jgi:hypothetical protein